MFLLQVSEDRWRLSVRNGPEYVLCSTYPQLMYVPKGLPVSYVERKVLNRRINLNSDSCYWIFFCIV